MSTRSRHRLLSVCAACILCAAGAHSETTAIVGATIIDGTGRAPLPNGVIVVDGGRIIALGRNAPIPQQARTINARGKYIIPGLMDANVHLVYGFSTEYLLRFESRFEDIVREGAQVALKSGVTTVFDTWGPLPALKTVRDEINAGSSEGSRIYLAGNIVGLGGPFSPDFYASTASVGTETIERINGMYEQGAGHELVYMDADDVRAAMRSYLDHGVDFLKFAVSGHGGRSRGFLLFSPLVQRVIIEEGKRRGLIVETHTTSVESLRMAVEAGVDLMQHCDLTVQRVIPDDLVAEIARRKIPCAMQIFPQRYLQHMLGAGLNEDPAASSDEMQQLFAVMQRNRRKLIDAGAVIVMATDGGVAYHDDPLLKEVFSRHAYPELAEDIVGFFGSGHRAWFRGASDAGLSPMRSLQAATRNVAAAYKKLDELGTLEVGKIADLVVLKGDPLADPGNYGTVDLVMKQGRIVDRDRLPTVKVLTREPTQKAAPSERISQREVDSD